MKRTDLAKSLGLKIRGQMQHAPNPGRFGAAAGAPLDRREQRKLDHAAGLVPFAVKLHNDLVKRLTERAAQEGVGLHELTGRLLSAGLAVEGEVAAAAAPVAVAPEAKKVLAAKKPAEAKLAETKPAKKASAGKKTVERPAKAEEKPASKKAAKKADKTAGKTPDKTPEKTPEKKTAAKKVDKKVAKTAEKAAEKPPAKADKTVKPAKKKSTKPSKD